MVPGEVAADFKPLDRTATRWRSIVGVLLNIRHAVSLNWSDTRKPGSECDITKGQDRGFDQQPGWLGVCCVRASVSGQDTNVLAVHYTVRDEPH